MEPPKTSAPATSASCGSRRKIVPLYTPAVLSAFKPLGSLSASRPKQLSPIELDNDDGALQGIDVDLEYLDDVSLFGCNNDDVWDQSGNDFTSDKADHGNTGSDDDLDDPRRRTMRESTSRAGLSLQRGVRKGSWRW